MVDISHGIFGGGGFLCGNGAKCSEHRAVDGVAVVAENVKYFL